MLLQITKKIGVFGNSKIAYYYFGTLKIKMIICVFTVQLPETPPLWVKPATEVFREVTTNQIWSISLKCQSRITNNGF